MNRKHVLTRTLPFTRTVVEERVTIERTDSEYRGRMSHVKRDRVEECRADFVLEIDFDGLVAALFKKAALSRGGKAQLASGLIRLVKRNEQYTSVKQREHPVRDGYAEVLS